MSSAGEVPSFDRSVGDEVILSMFSDALGREISAESAMTPEEELTAGVEVQGRLDTASELMKQMRDGVEVDIDLLRDTKAQFALLEIWRERGDS